MAVSVRVSPSKSGCVCWGFNFFDARSGSHYCADCGSLIPHFAGLVNIVAALVAWPLA
jgi:hypothetical protein